MTQPNDDPVQFNHAVMLAERLVRSKGNLAALTRADAPEALIASARATVSGRVLELNSNELAQSLLPQVRTVIAMREARRDYLNRQTLVGHYHTYFDDLYTELACSPHPEEDVAAYDAPEQACEVLAQAIRANNHLRAVGTVVHILHFIMKDLTEREEELPPVPPQYKVP